MNASLVTAVACATIAFVPVTTVAASAAGGSVPAGAGAAATMPCSQAVAAMASGMMMPAAATADASPAAGLTVDAAYTAAVASHVGALERMAKLEMRCGTDAKARAAAERALATLQRLR